MFSKNNSKIDNDIDEMIPDNAFLPDTFFELFVYSIVKFFKFFLKYIF